MTPRIENPERWTPLRRVATTTMLLLLGTALAPTEVEASSSSKASRSGVAVSDSLRVVNFAHLSVSHQALTQDFGFLDSQRIE
jgi:hypothetical protein